MSRPLTRCPYCARVGCDGRCDARRACEESLAVLRPSAQEEGNDWEIDAAGDEGGAR